MNIIATVFGNAYAIWLVNANLLAEGKNICKAFEILVETAEEITGTKFYKLSFPK